MSAVISTRTFGGVPHRCRVCRKIVWVEPSEPTGDAPCPGCGCLHWPGDRPVWGRALARSRALPSRAGRLLRRAPLRPVWWALASLTGPLRGAVKPAARRKRRAGAVAAPAAGGVWDPWLDG